MIFYGVQGKSFRETVDQMSETVDVDPAHKTIMPETVDPTPGVSTYEDDRHGFALFDKIRSRTAAFRFPEFDKFCFSGVVIDDAQAEGIKAVDSKVEALPEEGIAFVRVQSKVFQAKSEELQIKVKDGWDTTVETLQSMPGTFKEKWSEAREIYLENKRIEAEEAAIARAAARAKPPVPTVLTIQ